MQMLFVDESGTPPKKDSKGARFFVVGGVIIPESAWHGIRDAMLGLKTRLKIRGELKWRYFAPGNDDEKNPLRKLWPAQRDEVRYEMYRIICGQKSVRTIACVCDAPRAYTTWPVSSQNDLYHRTYKPVSERFQYYLQDLSKLVGRTEYGIIVADHRGSQDDVRLRAHHQKLIHSTGEFISNYANLIEGLFLEPSHLSVGLQLADMVAGAVWRKYERGDDHWFKQMEASLRRGPNNQIEGFGIVMLPRKKEDAG